MLTPLIILNLVLAGTGALLNRLHTAFHGSAKKDSEAILGGVLGVLIMNMILWLGYTVNAGFLLVLSITFPSFILGAGLAYFWNRSLRKTGR